MNLIVLSVYSPATDIYRLLMLYTLSATIVAARLLQLRFIYGATQPLFSSHSYCFATAESSRLFRLQFKIPVIRLALCGCVSSVEQPVGAWWHAWLHLAAGMKKTA